MKDKACQESTQPLWNIEADYALGFSRMWCRALGIWPWQRDEFFSLLRTILLIGIEVAAAVLLLERLFTKGNCGSMTDLIDALTGVTVFALTVLKISFPWYRRAQMQDIIKIAVEDWSHVHDKSQREIMKKYALWGRLAFIVQISGAFLIVSEMTLTRLPTLAINTNESFVERNLILGPSCWIPSSMPTQIYLIYYYVVLISLWGAALIYAGCDAFMFKFALHICGQFETLNIEIGKISDKEGHLQQKYRISKCSARHNQLLMLGNDIDNIANFIILSEFFSNAFLICISGIAILVNVNCTNFHSDVINFAIRIYVWYMELFMYSFVGEKLCSKAEELKITLYSCPWYNMSHSAAKDIKFMMMRNKFFCYLTAGGVVVINYETFKDLTRSMFSFFSVLKFMTE